MRPDQRGRGHANVAAIAFDAVFKLPVPTAKGGEGFAFLTRDLASSTLNGVSSAIPSHFTRIASFRGRWHPNNKMMLPSEYIRIQFEEPDVETQFVNITRFPTLDGMSLSKLGE